MKKINNGDGTFSLWYAKEKRFLLENVTEKEVDEYKKIIDRHNKDLKHLRKGIR